MANLNDFGFPFSSIAGDRQYSSDEWREYFGKLIYNGLIQNDGNEVQIKPQAVPNKTVFVETGSVFIGGVMRVLAATQTLTVADNTSGNPRIDRIVARLNEADRKIEFAVKQGTPAVSPVAPVLTRTSTVYELGLADVTLANGFSTITTGNILDTRSDVALCGASSMTIGVIPPSGLDAETVTLGTANAASYGVLNVDDALALTANARFYGKYSKMSGGSKSGTGIIPFTTEDNDDFSAINIGVSASRITIPAGVSVVRFHFSGVLTYTSSAAAYAGVDLYKNGSSAGVTLGSASFYFSSKPGAISNYSVPVAVTEGQYFEAYFAAYDASSVLSSGTFAMEVLK